MRTLSVAALFLLLAAASGRCVILDGFDTPQDDSKIRHSIQKRADVRRLIDEYNNVCRSYLLYLWSNELPATFGNKLKEMPKDFVLPVFQTDMILLNGMIDVSEPDRRHEDVYALGNIGYVKFFFYQDGQTMETVGMCFRPDAMFVPLKSTASVSRRLEWDRRKWQLVQAWLKARLAKDLRQDELFELDISQGKSRALGTDIQRMWRLVPFPRKNVFVPPVSSIHAAERVFNTIKLGGLTREAVANRLHMELRSARYDYDAPFYRVSGRTHRPFPKGVQVLKFDGGGFGFQFTLIYGQDGKIIRVEKQWIV